MEAAASNPAAYQRHEPEQDLLNPHLHILMLDGVYVTHPDSGQPTFVAVQPPTDEQVQRLIEQAAVRLIERLQRRGVLDDSHTDPLSDQEPVLAALTAASIQGTVATGERAGRRVRRVLADPAEGIGTAPLCFAARGFSKRRLAGAARKPPPSRPTTRPAANASAATSANRRWPMDARSGWTRRGSPSR